MRAKVVSLYKVYRFDNLPSTFFTKCLPLPADPQDLNETLRYYFPIKEPKALRQFLLYWSELKRYYGLKEKLLAAYFQLSPEKLYLTNSKHLSRTRPFHQAHFSVDSVKEDSINTAIDHLRKLYNFKYLPNDFIKLKPRLPKEPAKIKTSNNSPTP
ncbi:hypothetical protein C2G38_2183131 [Gigaspora rosea]|uniref:Uncharacterized protein n=1 Tax=Gigaspora rosea TaxID=44941 RepID=A0A397VB93_9GLOM|nr:hypothetical protein C2G38_2183131 [Gigaspora rosea]CAG8753294.1 11876_t:CDS:1 [Gigaspora rosea]